MNNRKRYNLLVGLVILNVFITIILFIMDLFLISWINQLVSLNQLVLIGFYLFLVLFEPIRISIMFISGIITIRIKTIDRKYKVPIITALLFGIGFNIYFLIRFYGDACFTPVYSFSCMLFIYIAFVLIVIQNHEKI